MNRWIGTSGFQYAEWKGTFYPDKMPVAKMLPFYANHFSTTEINYSFWRIPSSKTIKSWNDATPARFKFSLKAPQKVTHFARLHECADLMDYFSSIVSPLGEKLGPVLFQLPPDFEKDVPRLAFFLDCLPKRLTSAFEFRHESWCDEEVYDVLRQHNSALCIADTEKLTTPHVATADFGYLRLRREDYTEERIADWSEFVQSHEGRWHDTFIYFKHEESGVGPRFADGMIRIMRTWPVDSVGSDAYP